MQKQQLRNIKLQAGSRWSFLKHNLRHADTLLTDTDQLILQHLCPGSVLSFSFVDLQYLRELTSLSIQDLRLNYVFGPQHQKYNNLLLLNNIDSKYKTLEELQSWILTKVRNYLLAQGILIVSFNYQFVKINRLKYKFSEAIDKWIHDMNSQGLELVYRLEQEIPNTSPYGDNLFVFKLGDRIL